MNNRLYLSGLLTLALVVGSLLLWHTQKSQPSIATNVSTPTVPTVIAPARQIPATVNQNMQTALEARQKRLQEIEKAKE